MAFFSKERRLGKSKAGQSANEAALLVMFMTLSMIIALAAVSDDLIRASDNNYRTLLLDISEVIAQEAKIALSAEGGYFHQFTLPPTLNGQPYSLGFLNSTSISDQANISILSVASGRPNVQLNVTTVLARDVRGNLVRGQNTVRKEGGLVIFRPVSLSAAQEAECGSTCSGSVTAEECCDHLQLCCA